MLSIPGAFVALFVTHTALSMPSMIGLIMLMGTDPSFRAPMAIVVIGGLITSTFLSLLVIPVLFTFVDDAVQGLRRLLRRGAPAPSSASASASMTQEVQA